MESNVRTFHSLVRYLTVFKKPIKLKEPDFFKVSGKKIKFGSIVSTMEVDRMSNALKEIIPNVSGPEEKTKKTKYVINKT